MAEAQNSGSNIKDKVQNLGNTLSKMSMKMQKFPTLLQSLYFHLNSALVDDESYEVMGFRKIRDETRDDTLIYLNVHLPIVKELLTTIQHFFQYYNVFEYEEWTDGLDDICKDVKRNHECANFVKRLHEETKTGLKNRLLRAVTIRKKIKMSDKHKESVEYRKKARALE